LFAAPSRLMLRCLFVAFKAFFGTLQNTRIGTKLQPAVSLKEEGLQRAMSEERNLRLENAMVTLAEISAQHNERITATERSIQMLERSAQTLVELTADQQRRVMRLEESFVTLVDLLRSHGEGIGELKAAQVGSEQKIGALADAQIRTEERISQLTEAQKQTEAALKQLADAQAHTDQRLDALIDIVRDGRNGQSKN
jgi:hypothetical protein